MSLTILKATDPVAISTVITMIYGDPGAGKTSLAFTASKPLLLDFDKGAHRSGFRKDSVPVTNWADVSGLSAEDLAPYDTIIVDTVGRCLDAMSVDIIKANPKHGRDGALTLQGYGALKARFAAWMRQLRSFNKDVILVAHGVESKKGDDIILRPDIAGSSYGEVFRIADGVGYLHMVGKRRTLEFDPQERFVGKNPADLPPQEVPGFLQAPDFMARLVAETKAAMGALSADSQAVVTLVEGYRVRVDVIETADGMTELLAEVTALQDPAKAQVRALMKARADSIGIEWDAKAKAFKAVTRAA